MRLSPLCLCVCVSLKRAKLCRVSINFEVRYGLDCTSNGPWTGPLWSHWPAWARAGAQARIEGSQPPLFRSHPSSFPAISRPHRERQLFQLLLIIVRLGWGCTASFEYCTPGSSICSRIFSFPAHTRVCMRVCERSWACEQGCFTLLLFFFCVCLLFSFQHFSAIFFVSNDSGWICCYPVAWARQK